MLLFVFGMIDSVVELYVLDGVFLFVDVLKMNIFSIEFNSLEVVICVFIFVRLVRMEIVRFWKLFFLVMVKFVILFVMLLNVFVKMFFVMFVMLFFCVRKLFSVCDVFCV